MIHDQRDSTLQDDIKDQHRDLDDLPVDQSLPIVHELAEQAGKDNRTLAYIQYIQWENQLKGKVH